VIDPSGPAGGLGWEKAGFSRRSGSEQAPSGPRDVTEMSARELGQACESFAAAVTEGRLRHVGDPRLLAALQSAGRRDIGDGLWAWSRRRSGADISLLVAATGALWGLGVLSPAGAFFAAWR
jgi:hypothetical protein